MNPRFWWGPCPLWTGDTLMYCRMQQFRYNSVRHQASLYFLSLLSLENISFAFLYDDVCVKVFNRIVTFPLLQVGRTQNEQYNIYLEMSNIQFWLKRIPSIRVSFCHHRCFSSHNSLRDIHSIHPLHSPTPTFCSEVHQSIPIAF